MRLPKILIAVFFVLAFSPLGFGQEKPKAQLSAELGKICSEYLMAHYDLFLADLQNHPGDLGYIVFYGDRSLEGINLNYIRFVGVNYPRFRGFPIERLIIARGADRDEMKIQLWRVPPGAELPEPERKFVAEKIAATTLFDRNWADFHKSITNEFGIYSNNFYEANGCDFSPNAVDFADILLKNPELTGYLIVYGKIGNGKRRADRVAAFAVDDLVRNYKVPRTRLKAVYGGNRREPEIELWFVPRGEKPPAPDQKPKK